MNEKLINRLNECNICIQDILGNVEKEIINPMIYIYTSHLEGIGTKNSDFDIYVISENIPKIKNTISNTNYQVVTKLINNISLDIEYWEMKDICKLIDKINKTKAQDIDISEFKLLHRLRIAEQLGKNDGDHEQLQQMIETSNLNEQILRYYVILSNSQLQDAVSMYNNNELICALNCSYLSLEYAIAAFNASKGVITVKPKWISKLFINQKGYDKDIIEGYYKYQIFTNINSENISVFVKEKIEFIQDILSKISLM